MPCDRVILDDCSGFAVAEWTGAVSHRWQSEVCASLVEEAQSAEAAKQQADIAKKPARSDAPKSSAHKLEYNKLYKSVVKEKLAAGLDMDGAKVAARKACAALRESA